MHALLTASIKNYVTLIWQTKLTSIKSPSDIQKLLPDLKKLHQKHRIQESMKDYLHKKISEIINTHMKPIDGCSYTDRVKEVF